MAEHHHHHHHRHHHRHILDIPMNGAIWGSLILWGFILIGMPILYRGGEYWWLPTVLCLSFLATSFWLFCRAYFGQRISRKGLLTPSFQWEPAYLIPALVLAIGVVQRIHLPSALLNTLSSKAGEIWSWVEKGGTLSIWPNATDTRMTFILIAGLIFIAARNFCRHKNYAYCTLIAISLGTLLVSLVGFWQLIAPKAAAASPFVPADFISTPIRGVFINRNHFGFFMTLGFCAAAGLLMMLNAETNGNPLSSPGLHQRRKRAFFRGILAATLFSLYTANTACLSRGSFLSMNLALMCFIVIWFKERHTKTLELRRNELIGCIIFISAVLFALPAVLQRISIRFESLTSGDSVTLAGRLSIWKSTLHLIGNYWLTGVGLGAFEDAIQPYAYELGDEYVIVNAHNDFLEAIAEIGVPMSIVLAALCIWIIRNVIKGLGKNSDPVMKTAGMACFTALIASFLHELGDFSLQAYPNAFAFAALMGVLMAAASYQTTSQSPKETTPTSTESKNDLERKKRRSKRILFAFGVACLLLLIPSLFITKAAFANHLGWLIQLPEYKPIMGYGIVSPEKKLVTAKRAFELNNAQKGAAERYANALMGMTRTVKDNKEIHKLQRQAFNIQKKAIAVRPANSAVWSNHAYTSYLLLDFDEVQKVIERSIDLAPTLVGPKLSAAWFYYAMGPWYEESKDKKFQERAKQLRRETLRDRQDLSIKMLPSLLKDDTPIEDILEWCQPKEKLAYAILAHLQKRQRFNDINLMLDNFPKESKHPKERDEKIASLRVLVSHLLNEDSQITRDLTEEWLNKLRTLKESQYSSKALKTDDTLLSIDNLLLQLSNEQLGPLPSRRIEAAKIMLGVANIAGAVNILMPIVYPDCIWNASSSELDEASKLLEPLTANLDTYDGFRLEALRQMLKIKKGLMEGTVPAKASETLSSLHGQYWNRMSGNGTEHNFNRLSWLQAHLMDYYLGKCREADGNVQDACKYYEHILKYYRANFNPVTSLLRLSTNGTCANCLNLEQYVDTYPQAFFGSIASVISLEVSPQTISAIHENISISVTMKILDSTTKKMDFKARLSTKHGYLMTVPLTPVEQQQANSLLWEQGAIIRFHATASKPLTSLLLKNKKLSPQRIMIEIVHGLTTTATPRAITSVFLQEEKKND